MQILAAFLAAFVAWLSFLDVERGQYGQAALGFATVGALLALIVGI